jgi:hypothetical protein
MLGKQYGIKVLLKITWKYKKNWGDYIGSIWILYPMIIYSSVICIIVWYSSQMPPL